MKKIWLLWCALALPMTAHAQDPRMGARRVQLQGQIVERFMNHVSNELSLDPSARTKLHQHLRGSGEQRRDLARRSGDLRFEMMKLTRDTTTSDAEFRRLLSDMTSLRQQEEDLWKNDQESLARILTPRQHVRFIFMWLRFNDQIRELGRPGGPPPPMGRGRP